METKKDKGDRKMICPKCGHKNIPVYKVISKKSKNYRYRKCSKCKFSFRTIESSQYTWNYENLYKRILRDLNTVISKNKEFTKAPSNDD